MMTQNEKILEHMKKEGSISQLDALREFGCMRLASRISDLRKQGIPIADEWVSSVNRYGDTVRYKRYRLEA